VASVAIDGGPRPWSVAVQHRERGELLQVSGEVRSGEPGVWDLPPQVVAEATRTGGGPTAYRWYGCTAPARGIASVERVDIQAGMKTVRIFSDYIRDQIRLERF
jgi:hypothetical protein